VAALAGAFAQEQRRAGAAPWTAIGWESGAHAEPATVQAVGAVLRLLLAPGAPPQVLVSAGAADLGARLRESALAAALANAGDESAPARHGRPNLRNPYVPPSTATERSVVELWRLLLGIDEVGIHDSFLELGGDSLLATQLVTRVRERLNARVSLPEFFELPTAAALASRIDALRPATAAAEAAEVASLLEQLESLSAEEVEAMLAARGMGMEP
jgi:acyl carrier protein